MSPLLTIHNLRTYFFLDEGTVRAVDGVNLQIPRCQEAPPLLELSSQHHVACIARHDMKSDIIET